MNIKKIVYGKLIFNDDELQKNEEKYNTNKEKETKLEYFPRCEFFHRFENTSLFPNDIDYVHTYTRSTDARYSRDNINNVKFTPTPLTKKDTNGNSVSAHTGGFANPFILPQYQSIIDIDSEITKFRNDVNYELYNELLCYKLHLCNYIVGICKNRYNLMAIIPPSNSNSENINKQGIFCSNNYPCILVRLNPSGTGSSTAFFKQYNHMLMAYFIAIINYNAYGKGINIEMIGRSSFGHNNPTIAVTEESIRINIGLVPKVYAKLIAESIYQLYSLFK